MNLMQKLEDEEMKRMKKSIPEFSPGDTVVVRVNVVEGDKKREQAFEGADHVGKGEETAFLGKQQHELAGERSGTSLGEDRFHAMGLLFAGEDRGPHETGEVRARLEQALQRGQIGCQTVDRTLFRRQFEYGRGITQGQAACSAVVGRHSQSCL